MLVLIDLFVTVRFYVMSRQHGPNRNLVHEWYEIFRYSFNWLVMVISEHLLYTGRFTMKQEAFTLFWSLHTVKNTNVATSSLVFLHGNGLITLAKSVF